MGKAFRKERARIWLAAEATDMRCGFDRLAEPTQSAPVLGTAAAEVSNLEGTVAAVWAVTRMLVPSLNFFSCR
jgi:hypothetical protein